VIRELISTGLSMADIASLWIIFWMSSKGK
jgi:hypothetical protein